MSEFMKMKVGTFNIKLTMKFNIPIQKWLYAVAQLIEALRYKPEGRWFDSRCCH
jgi:hypothetical protein